MRFSLLSVFQHVCSSGGTIMSQLSRNLALAGLCGVFGTAVITAVVMVGSRHHEAPAIPLTVAENSPVLHHGFGHLHLAPAVTYANLMIYPVYADSASGSVRPSAPEFTTLAEGMDRGAVQAREADCQCSPSSQAVSQIPAGVTIPGPEATNAEQGDNHRGANLLMVTNVSPKPTYIPDGQVVPGGGQDRGAAADTIVPARSAQVSVAAFCVEANRSSGPSPEFSKEVVLAIPSVRYAMQVVGDQQPVWNSVAVATQHFGAATESGTYAALNRSRSALTAVQPYTEAMTVGVQAATPGRVVGVVAVINGRIVCADLYRNPTLFNQMWPALLRSYALQAAMVRPQAPETAPGTSMSEAGHWLSALDTAPSIPSRTSAYTQVARVTTATGAGNRTAAVTALNGSPGMSLLHEAFWTSAAALTN
jgi:hypothetical protein